MNFVGQVCWHTLCPISVQAAPWSDEDSNRADLMAELRLLVLGQYFAKSFARRAQIYHVTIPGKCATFICDFCLSGVQIYAGTRLVHLSGLSQVNMKAWFSKHFLQHPFWTPQACTLRGSLAAAPPAGCSNDIVGSAIDAYAHHVLVDSNGTFLLTDLQGMTFVLSPGHYISDLAFSVRRCRRYIKQVRYFV